MPTRLWGMAVSLGLVACGTATNRDSSDLVGVAGSAMSAPAGAGGSATGGGSVAGAPIAGTSAEGGVANGAGGAASFAGAAGLSGAGASAGGRAPLGPDPRPAGPPVAVVGTSNSYLVFTHSSTPILPTNHSDSQLMLLDLNGSGQPVQVSAAGTKLSQPTISADGRFFHHQQVDPSQGTWETPPVDDIYLAAFTEAGYLPGRLVAGFEERAALRRPSGFDASSRFATFVRFTEPGGFDIVDAASNTRYASLDVIAMDAFWWAPSGYLFSYRAKSTTVGSTASRTHIAKLVDGGISEPQPLPAGVENGSFSADGRRFFYSVENDTDPVSFGFVEPPAAPRQIYLGTRPNGHFGFEIEAGGQSLLTTLIDANDPTRAAVTRIFVDPKRPPERVAEPNDYSAIAISASGSLAALARSGGADKQSLEFLRGTERIKVFEAPSISASFIGEHLVYYLTDPSADTFWEVHSATLVGSTVADRRLAPADHRISSFCQQKIPKPGNKYIDVYDLPVPGIRFGDLELDGASAFRAIDATDPSATVDCAVCNAAEDACAYVERTGTGSKIFVMHFGPTGPSTAKLVFESDRDIVLSVAHLK